MNKLRQLLLPFCLVLTYTANAITPAQVSQLITHLDSHVKDSLGWAIDLVDIFQSDRIEPSKENYCSVLAIISQESGFRANPSIPNLGRIAITALNKKLDDMPLKSGKAVRLYLEQFGYLDRIAQAKTERDLDKVNRDILKNLYIPDLPFVDIKPIRDFFEDTNQISTIGSMQVSIKYAIAFEEWRLGRKLSLQEIWQIRDSMYHRKMGMKYGALMLLHYPTGYQQKIHRFADYNAGRYASRNAGFQYTIGRLLGRKLIQDGDLLIYKGDEAISAESNTEKAIQAVSARYHLGLSKQQIRHDLLYEKAYIFYDSETYNRIKKAYIQQFGEQPPVALIPSITLQSEKTSSILTTKKFATHVYSRYQKCMAQAERMGL